MTSLLSLTAEQVLAQRWLFDPSTTDSDAKQLLKRWHPDLNPHPRAADVFKHVREQWEAAKKGTFANTLTIKLPRTGPMHFKVYGKRTFELGELYVCQRYIIWAAERSADDLAKRGLETVKSFKFPSKEIEDKLGHALPHNIHTVAQGDRSYTIMHRNHNWLRCADILEKLGPLDPKAVAWILSRAYNLLGFLDYSKLTHLDVSKETFFVEPSTHLGALLGGWYYSAPPGKKPLAVPARHAGYATLPVQRAHLQQVRQLGRELLGAPKFSDLKKRTDVGEPLRGWLLSAPGTDVRAEINGWRSTLEKTFGERKFTPFNVKLEDIYP